jgi:hypothetical protein
MTSQMTHSKNTELINQSNQHTVSIVQQQQQNMQQMYHPTHHHHQQQQQQERHQMMQEPYHPHQQQQPQRVNFQQPEIKHQANQIQPMSQQPQHQQHTNGMQPQIIQNKPSISQHIPIATTIPTRTNEETTHIVTERKGRFSVLQEVKKGDLSSSNDDIMNNSNPIDVQLDKSDHIIDSSSLQMQAVVQTTTSAPLPTQQLSSMNTKSDSNQQQPPPGTKIKGRFLVTSCDAAVNTTATNSIQQHIRSNSYNTIATSTLSDIGQKQNPIQKKQNHSTPNLLAPQQPLQQQQPKQHQKQLQPHYQTPSTSIPGSILKNTLTSNIQAIHPVQQQQQESTQHAQLPKQQPQQHPLQPQQQLTHHPQQIHQQALSAQHPQQTQHGPLSNKSIPIAKTSSASTSAQQTQISVDRERIASLSASCNTSKKGLSGAVPGGMGKMLHYLEQMKSEVIEADKMIQTLQSDVKHLVS